MARCWVLTRLHVDRTIDILEREARASGKRASGAWCAAGSAHLSPRESRHWPQGEVTALKYLAPVELLSPSCFLTFMSRLRTLCKGIVHT